MLGCRGGNAWDSLILHVYFFMMIKREFCFSLFSQGGRRQPSSRVQSCFCFDNKVKSEEADRTFQWLLVSRLTYCIFQTLVIATHSLWSLSSEVIFLITERHGAIKLMLSLRTRRVEVKRFWEMSDLCTQSCPGCPLPPPACSCAVKLSENHFHDWTQWSVLCFSLSQVSKHLGQSNIRPSTRMSYVQKQPFEKSPRLCIMQAARLALTF